MPDPVKIADLIKETSFADDDSFVFSDSSAGLDKRIEGADLRKNVSADIENVTALKLFEGTRDGQIVDLLGYYEEGDGGEGKVWWDASSTATADDGMIFQVTGVDTGRWKRFKRIFVDIKKYGAVGDYNGTSGTDNSSAVDKWIDFIIDNNMRGLVSEGWYDLGELYKDIVGDLKIIGEGRDISRFYNGAGFDIEGSLVCEKIGFFDFGKSPNFNEVFDAKITEVPGKVYDISFEVRNCRFNNVQEALEFDLVEITWLPQVWESGNLTLKASIEDNIFENSDDIMVDTQGLYDDIRITGNIFKDIEVSTAFTPVVTAGLSRYTRGIGHCHISDNHFEDITTDATADSGDRGWCILANSDNAFIKNNTLKNFETIGITGYGVRTVIKDNILDADDDFTSSGYKGIEHKARINLVPDTYDSFGIQICDNTINIDLDAEGIYTQSGAKICGNRMYGNIQGYAISCNTAVKPLSGFADFPLVDDNDPTIQFNHHDIEVCDNYAESCAGMGIGTYNVKSAKISCNIIKRDKFVSDTSNALRVGLEANEVVPKGVEVIISENHVYDMDIVGQSPTNMIRTPKGSVLRDNYFYYNNYSVFILNSHTIKNNTFKRLDNGVTTYDSNVMIACTYDAINEITGEVIGVGDGTETEFQIDEFPIIADSETVYIDDVETANYTINDTTGLVTMNTAPALDEIISIDYNYLADISGFEISGNKVEVPSSLSVARVFRIINPASNLKIEDNEFIFGDGATNATPFYINPASALNELIIRDNKLYNESTGVFFIEIDLDTAVTANKYVIEGNVAENKIAAFMTYNENVNHLIAKNNIIPFDNVDGLIPAADNTPLFTNVVSDNVTLNQVT